MILEKISDSLNPDVLFHGIDYNLNYFGLVFGIEDLTFALKKDTDTVEWKNFKGFNSDDSVEHEKKLFDMDVANEAVENPGEDQSQGLNVELLKLID
jgi:hypothetical protein